MGYNGYTDKKKESNKKYMDKMARLSIWVTPEEKEAIEDKAKQSGKSINQYVKDCSLA